MVFGTYADAQFEPCVVGGTIMGVGTIGPGLTRPNIPYSGVVKSTFEQKLVDGNAIHRTMTTHQARDSAGRTMTEMVSGCALGDDGHTRERLSVNVNDPVARTNMNWQVGADDLPKIVHVFHQPDLRSANGTPVKRRELTPAQLEQQQKMVKAAQAREAELRKETRTEDLGVRDFHGVSASGTRTTRTIPAGQEGNDQPLIVINETWRSKDLGMVMMTIREDPRTGRSVTEFEEFTRGEPDSSLFAPPAGYTVQDQPLGGGIIGGLAGAVLQ
jgi:hypothetical protein